MKSFLSRILNDLNFKVVLKRSSKYPLCKPFQEQELSKLIYSLNNRPYSLSFIFDIYEKFAQESEVNFFETPLNSSILSLKLLIEEHPLIDRQNIKITKIFFNMLFF